MSTRLPALPDDRVEGSVAELFAGIVASGGSVPPAYRLLAYSPRMLRAWHDFAAPMREVGDIAADLKELAILRVAHVTGSNRQWRHHVGLAVAAGVSEAALTEVSGDLAAEPFTVRQLAVLRLADELAAYGAVSEQTFADALAVLGEARTIELVMVASYYRCLAGILATVGLS